MEGAEAYLAGDIPERFHFKNNRWVPDILIVAYPGTQSFLHFVTELFVGTSSANDNKLKRVAGYYVAQSRSTNRPRMNGYHGYDNLFEDMRSIFFAKGPGKLKDQVSFKLCFGSAYSNDNACNYY